MRHPLMRWLTQIALCGWFGMGASLSLAEPASLTDLRRLDIRLIDVGTRLAVSAAPLCEPRQWQAGITLHDLSQYPRAERATAAATFGLGDGPAVLALAPGGAAARAGVRLDDTILAVDGAELPAAPPDAENGFGHTERMIDAFEAAFADGVATLTISRAGENASIEIAADPACLSRFQVLPSRRLEARADGRYVQISSAMIEFTFDDDELAAVVAHELAHNILRHRVRLNAAGVDRGLLSSFGRNGRLFRRAELEADRLAIHLMVRAGFDPMAAVRLWTRQSRSDSRLFAGTHPDWSARIAALEGEIAAIGDARARGAEATIPLTLGPIGGERAPAAATLRHPGTPRR